MVLFCITLMVYACWMREVLCTVIFISARYSVIYRRVLKARALAVGLVMLHPTFGHPRHQFPFLLPDPNPRRPLEASLLRARYEPLLPAPPTQPKRSD